MSNKHIIQQATTYNGLPLSPTSKGDEGFYQDILDAIKTQMNKSLEQHSQVLFMLFTFSFPANSHTNPLDNIVLPDAEIPLGNDVFVYFLNQYKRRMNNYGFDMHYVWIREQTDTCNHCHYHLALWLDANKIRYFGSLEEINAYWSQALARFKIIASGANTAGLIDRGRYEQEGKIEYWGQIVHRGNPEEFADVFQRASYLAKAYSKDGFRPYRTRVWGSSN